MKNFDYIEHVINDNVTEKSKLRFIERLINDPELRKQYHQYIQVAEEIEQQEDIIRSVNQALTGYAFNINEAARLLDMQGSPRDNSRTTEDSCIIRSVIEANKPPTARPKNGWFRAAAVLSIGLLVITSGLISGTDTIRYCDIIVLVI